MGTLIFHGGTIILEDRLLDGARVEVEDDGQITAVEKGTGPGTGGPGIDLGGYLAPGFVDLHVHGGDGADFMDGTAEAFRTVCRATPATAPRACCRPRTVARHEQHLAFLDAVPAAEGRRHRRGPRPRRALLRPVLRLRGPRLPPGRRRSPAGARRVRAVPRVRRLHRHGDRRPGVAGRGGVRPRLPAKGVRCNAGHSHATFAQMEAAVGWGVRHVDHLFCAMSDRARLRQTQTYPMRGGVMEATLYFDELTTEVIADGKHLQRELLLLAYKIKGPDRLALVTDCNRALDMPDGEYMFGPLDGGEPMLKARRRRRHARRHGAGVRRGRAWTTACGRSTADRRAAGEGRAHGEPDAGAHRRAASARSAAFAVGKRADLVVLDRELNVRQVYRDGRLIRERDGERV